MECIVPIFWSLSGKVRYQHFWKLEYRLCPDSDAMFHCRKCKDTFYSQSLPSFYRQVLRCNPYPFLVTSAIWHYAGRPRWSRCQPWTEDQAPSLPCPLQCTAGDDGSVADISCMSIFSHVSSDSRQGSLFWLHKHDKVLLGAATLGHQIFFISSPNKK